MKRLFIFLFGIFVCIAAIADTITLNFLNEDNTNFSTSTCTIGGNLNIPNTAPTKRGYTFDGWLPANVQRIEYLESTGTQYIDTGFTPNQNTGIKARFVYNSISNSDNAFGSSTSDGQKRFQSFIWDKKEYFTYNTQYCILTQTAEVGDIFEIDWNKNFLKYKLNNSNWQTYTFNSSTFVSPRSMCLFVSCKDVSSPTHISKITIYYFQIYDNDVLVRDFVPVIDENNIPCLYDKVTMSFFYNKGVGSNFIAGPVVGE